MKKSFILVLIGFCFLFVCSCKNDTSSINKETASKASTYEKSFWDNYGGANAVIEEYDDCDSEKLIIERTYNLSNVSEDYIEVVKDAIDTANSTIQKYSKSSYFNYDYEIIDGTIVYLDSGNAKITITKEYIDGDENINGVARACIEGGKLRYRDIELCSKKMDNYTANGKAHIILHELGHVMGLDDMNDIWTVNSRGMSILKQSFEEYTIMYGSYNKKSKYTFIDYTKFDTANLDYLYD